ncbi:HAMP domain-containing sensor histidine kinase [Prosthecobacter sp.]|uniref:sensor histidine kinase n=1 Tax=Prosthecobacter sp. TaxID=1965333 RepID=UPI001E16E913|nr:HAMP domain-containing sensor histidine kinase [Prosthecobacter sp.]MCB1274964.1 HAMP domain-containing histidine kinase [Prosthecobacter sp.]
MNRLRLPLFGKILAWFALNLAVLALLFFFFLKAQFHLGLDWMLSGEPGDRIAAIGDSITQELSRIPEAEWSAQLETYDRKHGVTFALFTNTGEQLFGAPMKVPADVMPRLIDRRSQVERPPPRRPPGPMMKRPDDAPPKPRFMLRAGNPAAYWAGIHLDLVSRSDGRPMTLLMKSGSITGGGLFLDLWPWLGLGAVALVISALIWMPFVRGITGFIGALNSAAGRIARGKFDERISQERNDELGELSSSVNAMAAQLGDYVAQQRRITADVAHELCSPIARMQMALGVVEQRSTPEQASYLKKLDAELQHMAKLVEEVLAFSKAETLPEREIPEDIDLHDLIDSIIAREAPDADIQVDVPTDQRLRSLRNALDRAIGNILRNAVRYAGNAGPIQIHASQHNDQILIRISDQGPGVPAEALPRLFEPFYRPEAARQRSTGGSGLGLAITQRCIEACGGTITACNRDPHGLIVEMGLPLLG